MHSFKEFITDFKQSPIVERLTSQYDVVMIWLSGSAAIGLTDTHSDYDLGVLVADPVIFSKTEKTTELYQYKVDQKDVHCIYNSFEDIKASPCEGQLAPYRHLGWAQFKYIKAENIIYINPKYAQLVAILINNRFSIAENAMNTFLKLLNSAIQFAENHWYIPSIAWGKMLSHICWCVDELREQPHDVEKLVALKRVLGSHVGPVVLAPDLLTYAAERLDWARHYLAHCPDTYTEVSSLIDTLVAAYGK